MEQKIIQNTIKINATPHQIWEVLTLADHTQKYMYGCKAISTWEEGALLKWEMLHEGKLFIPVEGIILTIEKPFVLTYTVIDPYADYENIIENHLQVNYHIEAINENESRLTISQYGFEAVESGEKRYEEIYNDGKGWESIVQQIKNLAEAL